MSSPDSPVVQPEEPKEQPHVPEAAEQRDLFARARRPSFPMKENRQRTNFRWAVTKATASPTCTRKERRARSSSTWQRKAQRFLVSRTGLALSISVGLQYGVPLKALVDKLTNTRFEPSGFTENPSIRYASSVLDYLARWLGGKFLSSEHLKPKSAFAEEGPSKQAIAAEASFVHTRKASAGLADAPSCSTCGMLMVPNGSCYKCVNCGGTSGCS